MLLRKKNFSFDILVEMNKELFVEDIINVK